MEQQQPQPKQRRTLRIVINALVYVLIIGGITLGVPKFLAWHLDTPYPMATITSGSMWPALKEGDLVFIQGVHGKEDVAVGDIIVYRNTRNNTFTIHRIVSMGNDTLTTQGDANFSEDASIEYEDIVGKTYQVFGRNVRIPHLGVITVYANKHFNSSP